MGSFAANSSGPTGILLASGKRQTGVALLTALVVAVVMAGGWMILAGFAAGMLAIILFATVCFAMINGNADKILVGWVFLYPLGYYFLSYPRNQPVIQFDRIVAAIVFVCILAAPRAQRWDIPTDMKRVGWAWVIFLAATGTSFLQTTNVLGVGRLIVDALVVPAMFGWYVVRQFRLMQYAKVLHLAVCVVSVFCAVIATAEVILQQDLLSFEAPGDEFVIRAGPGGFSFFRPNGPFWTGTTLTIGGLISFFLLTFLWRQIRDDAGWLWRVLHVIGAFAALLQSLLQVARATFLALIVTAIIAALWSRGRVRVLRLAGIGLLALIPVVMAVFLPAVFQDRADATNVNNRMAQNLQSWRVFIDHPIFGVGLTNLFPTATANPRYQTLVLGEPPLNYPHSNLAWLAAETGLAGFIPFVVSQVFLVIAFRHLAGRGDQGQTAWRFFVFIFLSYWIVGVTETGAEYGELNVWFVFAVALLYRFGYGASSVAETRSPSVISPSNRRAEPETC